LKLVPEVSFYEGSPLDSRGQIWLHHHHGNGDPHPRRKIHKKKKKKKKKKSPKVDKGKKGTRIREILTPLQGKKSRKNQEKKFGR